MRVKLPLRAIAIACSLVLVTACQGSNESHDGSALTTSTAAATSVTGPDSTTAPPPVEWEDCGGVECATVAAPVDYDDPDGATIDLYVTRVSATGERHGALWINFGGPGGSAADTISTWPVPDAVTEHFDLIGMDPRGVGRSSPLECGLDALELYAADPTIDEPSDTDALLDVSQRYIDDCRARSGDILPHMGTRNVARDMDLIRSMMGDERIDFLGYSYGTSIGQTYGELFPDRVRTMVLDGIVDPGLSGPALAKSQAQGFEKGLQRWSDDCDERSCPLDDPIDAVDRVLEAAEAGIPTAEGGTVGPGEAANAIAYPLYSPQLWPRLDEAIATALSQDPSGLMSLAVAYSELVNFSAYFAVSCLDSQWPDDPQELLDIAASTASESPRFGEAVVNDYIRCALWPAEEEPLGALTASGVPPILIVSTTGDAATPYENGVTVADRIESAVLVTHRGEGHTIVFQGNECVDGYVVDYIVNETVPSHDVTC